jgi:ferredoxin-like protein FixX
VGVQIQFSEINPEIFQILMQGYIRRDFSSRMRKSHRVVWQFVFLRSCPAAIQNKTGEHHLKFRVAGCCVACAACRRHLVPVQYASKLNNETVEINESRTNWATLLRVATAVSNTAGGTLTLIQRHGVAAAALAAGRHTVCPARRGAGLGRQWGWR